MVTDKMEKKIDSILNIMQKLFIFEAADRGLTKNQVREILGVNANEITKIWKHLKNDK
jgi:NAD(P)H-nitrite reductase large subunit